MADSQESLLVELDAMLANPSSVQEETLLKILHDNANCEYLSKFGVSKEKLSKHLFKSLVPLSDYEDIEEYVERIAGGDKSPLLCSYPVRCFSISSGTTAGKSKKFPETREYESAFETAQQFMLQLVIRAAIESDSSNPMLHPKGKIFSVTVAGRQFETRAGHKVGSALTNYYRGEEFKKSYDSKKYTSPIEVVLSEDSPQALYCHLLCGLLQPSQVWCLEAGFAFNMDAAFTMLRNSWQGICKDIRNGTVSEEVKDENVRRAVLKLVQTHASPEVAELIWRECSKSSWEGIVRRLWPNALYIQCRAGGPLMKPYVSRINYYSGNMPIYGLSYGASEGGHLAICRQPTTASTTLFTFLPTTAFFEFIPLTKLESCGNEGFVPSVHSDNTREIELDTLELGDLQVGHYYQPVVTTFQGLYRYKLGDVVRMKGMKGGSPEMEFVQRNNILLSVNSDKTDEGELQSVMERASALVRGEGGMEVVEYTSCVDHSCSPGHYVIFVEVEGEGGGPVNPKDEKAARIMQECCCMLDASFNHAYKKGRKAGRIGALEMRVVGKGSFEKVMRERLERGGISMSQYKPPRSIAHNSPLQVVLEKELVAAYRSSLTTWDIYQESN